MHLFRRARQQPGAGGADGAGGTDHHGLALYFLALFQLYQTQPGDGVMGGPQGAGGAVAVAGGDRQRGAFGDGHTRVPDHLGEGPQAHYLGAHFPGHVRGGQQLSIGKLRAVRHDLFRRTAHQDQPALGLDAGGGRDALHFGVDQRRCVGDRLFHRVHHQRR